MHELNTEGGMGRWEKLWPCSGLKVAEEDDDGTAKEHDSLSERHRTVAGMVTVTAGCHGQPGHTYRGATCSGLDSHPRGTMEAEDRGEVKGRKCLQ